MSTGSHEMVSEHLDWSERTAAWLPGLVERKIPVLGICYGHQLLAYAMGGKVGHNPLGRHFGTVNVDLAPEAGEDLLFLELPNPVRCHVCHTQCVLELPPDALLLASNDKDPHQAFVVGDSAWGIQFHPEFNRTILREYIERYRKDLREEGQDPDKLIKESTETSAGPEFLRRFAEIVEARETSLEFE